MTRMRGLVDVDHEFKSLRLSALTNAIQIAPFINEATIGPDCFQSFNNASPDNQSINKSNGKYSPGSEDKRKSKTPEQTKDNRTTPNANISYEKIKQSATVPYEKLLHECELKRREAADVMLNHMLSKMVAKRAEMMTKFWHQQELEYEKRSQERRNREVEILQEWALGDRMAKLEQEKLDVENKAQSERMRILLEKQLESTKLFENLNNYHTQMCTFYEEITNISTSNNAIFSKLLQKFEPSLSSILSSMNLITERCKSGVITPEEVEKAAILTSKMRDLKTQAFVEFENATKASEEATRQSKAKQQEELTPTVETINAPVHNNHNVPKSETLVKTPAKVKYCSNKSLNLFVEFRQFLTAYEASYKELLQDDSLKKFRFDLQKAVNTPVNAISSVSGGHLKDKYDKLLKLLSGDRVRVGDIYVSCALHPQGIPYCTDLLAKKLVQQGEHLVSSSPDAAYPIASVIIALWARFPDLGKLILAHLQQDCPYLVPMMMPQCQGLSDENFYKTRGYRYNEDGTIEKQDKFLKRMSGIFRLCAAIWVTKMPNSVNCAHPHGLAHAWRWMAAFINLDPEADISATLLFDFLTVCGSEFFKHYRGQFVKVLNHLITDFRARVDKIDEGGPKTRLEVFLQNVVKDGHISPPSGILPERLW